jgi:alpha-L-fucosidase
MRRAIDATYGINLAASARAAADAEREGFAASRAVDGDAETFWAVPESATRGALTLAWPSAVTFDRVVLQEPIALGQRVAAFEIEAVREGQWRRIAAGSTIGYKRIVAVPRTTTDRVRVTIHEARACPLVAEVGVFRLPD